MLRYILLRPIESGTSTWKSLWSYCLFNCWPSVEVRVIKLIISPWFTTRNITSALNAEPFKCSAFISVCCQLYCILSFLLLATIILTWALIKQSNAYLMHATIILTWALIKRSNAYLMHATIYLLQSTKYLHLSSNRFKKDVNI
jgi:hypothetical protein